MLYQTTRDLANEAKMLCSDERVIVGLDGKPLQDIRGTVAIWQSSRGTLCPLPIANLLVNRELTLILDRFRCALYEPRELALIEKNCSRVPGLLLPYLAEHATMQ
ncbi:MAG: hypothetical protein KGI41_01850 [Patescibacteria group bacterium]|nr:hypothetical protein [Patescibacteria group bacterium]